jgi:hypothetical protein
MLYFKGNKIMKTKRAWNFKDLTGQIFGRLTVIKIDKIIGRGIVYWWCKCRCGNTISIKRLSLTTRNTKSCGCLNIDKIREVAKNNVTHGMTNTRLFRIWSNMKNRCLNLKDEHYPNYGGRGIIVCKRWLKFENFLEDMYESYLKHVEEFGEKDTSIDRYPNNDGDYKLSNCRWATLAEQNRHTRLSTKSVNLKEHQYWRMNLKNGVNSSINYGLEISYIDEYLGCSSLDFRRYLEYLFLPGMTWKNWGNGPGKWQIDHIIGCNNFDLSKEKNRKKCFNYSNMRPMWYKEHLKKSRRRV